MSEYRKCPNGHYYTGEVCPYCKTEETDKTMTDMDHTIVMPQQYKKCINGHYYKGDTCPYCKTKSYGGTRKDNAMVVPQYKEIKTFYIPICPQCEKPVRKEMPHHENIGSIGGNAYDGKTPWNYHWNGRCEHCGYDFSIIITQKIDSPYNDRQTIVRVSQRQLQAVGDNGEVFHDAFVGLSGIEIEQYDNIDGIKKTFISTNELKYLINVLKNSPLLEQLDWNEDWT